MSSIIASSTVLLRLVILFPLLWVAPAFAQDEGVIYYDSRWKECDEDQALFYRVYERDSDTSYVIADYFIGDRLQMKGRAKQFRGMETAFGTWTWYYYTGQKERVAHYVNGIQQGEEVKWFPNGQVENRGMFRDAKKIGIWKSWHRGGEPASVEEYIVGDTLLRMTNWHPNGQMSEHREYDSITHRLLKGTYWYDDGRLEAEAVVNADGTHRWVWFDHHGDTCAIETYDGEKFIRGHYINEDGSEHTDRDRAWSAPMFRGGDDEFVRFLGSATKYPETARRNGIEGKVEVLLAVAEDGSLRDVQIYAPSNELLNEEALRVVRSMTGWTPGSKHNRPGLTYMTIPFVFKLK